MQGGFLFFSPWVGHVKMFWRLLRVRFDRFAANYPL
jgi:hypothetical protein